MQKIEHLGYKVAHLIPADLEFFDFDQLIEEYQKNNSILWRNGNIKDGKNARKYKLGDICYFYYTNLPDFSQRILLVGTVIDNDATYDSVRGIRGIRIDNLKTISLRDEISFSLKRLREEYALNGTFRSSIYLYSIIHEKLLKDLEDATEENTLQDIKEYFDEKSQCIFSLHEKKVHPTFIKNNGLRYFDIHHHIQSHVGKKNPDYAYIVDTRPNKFCLCATCHKQIHNGRNKDRKRMVTILYQINKQWYDENFINLANRYGYKDVLSYIYSLYNIN